MLQPGALSPFTGRGQGEGLLMPHVVMAGMAARRWTGGLSEFEVEADTVRRMITELDRRFPGLGQQIDESMAVAINGEIYQDAYMARLEPDSEVVLIPKIGGG
jgi:sulfur-carrier protein